MGIICVEFIILCLFDASSETGLGFLILCLFDASSEAFGTLEGGVGRAIDRVTPRSWTCAVTILEAALKLTVI